MRRLLSLTPRAGVLLGCGTPSILEENLWQFPFWGTGLRENPRTMPLTPFIHGIYPFGDPGLGRTPGTLFPKQRGHCPWMKWRSLTQGVSLFSSRQVATQCQLLQTSLGCPSSPQLPQLPDELMSLQDAPGGLFQLPPGDPFPERVTVVWLSVLALAFALVCEPQENLSLAEITLRRLAPRLLVSLRLLVPVPLGARVCFGAPSSPFTPYF
uniref:Adaptor related protein complex 5 subunit sigma 1 n=1 Tax=Serinus canaria TaxID=9135 RepID=A0A8C9NF30_SERCA